MGQRLCKPLVILNKQESHLSTIYPHARPLLFDNPRHIPYNKRKALFQRTLFVNKRREEQCFATLSVPYKHGCSRKASAWDAACDFLMGLPAIKKTAQSLSPVNVAEPTLDSAKKNIAVQK